MPAWLALSLAAALLQPDPVNDARRAYADCLRAFMLASLQAETEPAAFEAALATQCGDRSAAYREALIRRDARTGGSRARAEEDGRIMIDDTKANILELYRDYHSTDTMPPR